MKREQKSPWERTLEDVEKSARKLVKALSKRMLDEYSAETQIAISQLKEDLSRMNKMRDC